MKSRLRDLSHYGTRKLDIPAENFNRVRLGLHRLENPIRLSMPGLHNVDLLLDDETWIAVDQFHRDAPVLALTDFESLGRRSLQAPVHCRIYFYYASSELILNRLLQSMHRLLGARLEQRRGMERGKVLMFPKG